MSILKVVGAVSLVSGLGLTATIAASEAGAQPGGTPTLSTAASIGPSGGISDAATVTGDAGGGAPTGNVTFYLCQTSTSQTLDPGTCNDVGGNTFETLRLTTGNNDTSTATSASTDKSAGTWCFSAKYAGSPDYDSTVDNVTTLESNECVLVSQSSSATISTISAESIPLGPSSTVSDTVSVTGTDTDGSPTGTVTFYVCQTGTTQTLTPSYCTPSGTPEDTETLSPGSSPTSFANSASFQPTGAGTWCFSAIYSGDNNYTGSADNTTSDNLDPYECVLVAQATSTTATVVSPASLTLGPSGTVTDSVTVTGNSAGGPPTGSVSFYVCQTGTTQTPAPNYCTPSGTPEDTETLAPAANDPDNELSDATSIAFTPNAAGTWCFSAMYSGDNNYTGSSDNTTSDNLDSAECALVARAPSTTATTISPASLTLGPSGTVTDSVTVTGNPTGGPPTGSVSFYVCQTGTTQTPAPSYCTPSGTPEDTETLAPAASDPDNDLSDATSIAFTPTSAGTWCFSAVYSSDTNYAASQGNTTNSNLDSNECALVAQATSSSATVISSASLTLGPSGTVTDSVTVTGNPTGGPPTGSVSFYVCQTGTTQTPAPSYCTPSGTPEDTETLAPAASDPDNDLSDATSIAFTPTSAGTWCFSAVYSSDSNYTGSRDNTTNSNLDSNECALVAQATSTSATVISSASLTLGPSGTVTDSVTVTGNPTGRPPTGDVSFYVCRTGTTQTLTPSYCTPSGPTEDTETLSPAASDPNNDKSDATSIAYRPTTPGTWCFSAVYGGDSNYTGSQDNTSNSNLDSNECALVAPASPTTATMVGAVTFVVGQSPAMYDSVTVTGNSVGAVPQGSVDFYVCGPSASDALCSSQSDPEGTPVLSQATADSSTARSSAFSPPSPGIWCFGAVYVPTSGGNYVGSSDNVSGSVDSHECVLAQAPYTFTSAASTTATKGSYFSFLVTTAGTPLPKITKKGPLPLGVKFVNNGNGSGTLSGVPKKAGTYPITFTGTFGTGKSKHIGTQAFTLQINT